MPSPQITLCGYMRLAMEPLMRLTPSTPAYRIAYNCSKQCQNILLQIVAMEGNALTPLAMLSDANVNRVYQNAYVFRSFCWTAGARRDRKASKLGIISLYPWMS